MFKFSVSEESRISLKIYTAAGRLIAIPVRGEYSSGFYQIPFKPKAKGIYFYKLESEYENKKGKFVIF